MILKRKYNWEFLLATAKSHEGRNKAQTVGWTQSMGCVTTAELKLKASIMCDGEGAPHG